MVGLRQADPARRIERHQHEDAHLVLVTQGRYRTTARGGPSTAPLLIYNPPGTTHDDAFLFDGDRCTGEFLSLSLPPDFLSTHHHLGLAEGHATVVPDPLAIGLSLELARLLRTPRADAGNVAVQADAAAWELVSRVSHREERPGREPPPWLAHVLRGMIEAPTARRDVRGIAAEAGVHPVHLARVFRAHVGSTPGAVQRALRLARAAALLRRRGPGAPSLAAVAHLAGYVDQAHLTRSMRACYDTTPGRLREERGRSMIDLE